MRQGTLGLHFQGGRVRSNRPLMLSLASQCDAPAIEGRAVLLVETNDFVEVRNRLVVVAEVQIGQCPIVVGRDILRTKPQDGRVVVDGVEEIAAASPRQS